MTAQNIGKLRKLVKSGPDVYPGARFVQFPDGSKHVIPPGNSDDAVARRLALSNRLTIPQSELHGGMPMIVSAISEDETSVNYGFLHFYMSTLLSSGMVEFDCQAGHA